MRTRGSTATLALILLCITTSCGWIGDSNSAPGSPIRSDLEQLLNQVAVVDTRPHPGGYQRGCGSGEACVFGQSWSDDQDAPGGHDGCDTRNNVLAQDLSSVIYKPDTHNCVVLSGTMTDPYSGEATSFDRQQARSVQIDHVYPLAAAWDFGAHSWPLPLRKRFANDTQLNLLAVNGPDNQAKGDSTPSEWLPPNPAYHCFYAGKYLTVAVSYGLPISRADHQTLTDLAANC
ncbi:deoxyribonuclease [Rhodococcus sp. SRB_17]|nr:deoxyribonuclease [Rhodococcus sp. SRB_17]